jgi:hypothetical protein
VSTPCSVCRHPASGDIDSRLRSGHTARAVSEAFFLSYDALTRHTRNHLPYRDPEPAVPEARADAMPVDPLEELVVALRRRALAGDTAAAREYRLALAAQTAARTAALPVVALESTAEWLTLRRRILAALEPFPAARTAVAEAIA